MRAVRFVGVGHPAQITDVAKPAPGAALEAIEQKMQWLKEFGG